MTSEIDAEYGKIQAIVKANPALASEVSAQLAEIVEELENKDSVSEITGNLGELTVGFHKFKKHFYSKHSKLHNELKTGQWPTYMVVACSDSRVCPTAVLGLKPGDAFVVRNVANIVPAWEKEGNPSLGSALEYAVLHLKVKNILIIGHKSCGGMGALVKMVPEDGKYSTDFIERWVGIAKPARAAVKAKLGHDADVGALCQSCEKESVNNSLHNLKTYPFVVDAVSQGKITLHGGYYDFVNETFETWDYTL